jgi:hypothetical protein
LLRVREENSHYSVSVRTVSTRKRVADERNDGFRMSSIVGEEGIVVNQALAGVGMPRFERFDNL